MQKLCIVTDIRNDQWLKYIVQEFKSIQDARFEIAITSSSSESDAHCIYYLKNGVKGPCIPQRTRSGTANSETQWISSNIYILRGTGSHSNGLGLVDYDLFWNAFVFLSRLEEYRAFCAGHPVNSLAKRHPREDKNTFSIPIVNRLFNELEKAVRKVYPQLEFGSRHAPMIEYSHDVDYIRKTIPLRLKQSAFNIHNIFRTLGDRPKCKKAVARTVDFFLSNASYFQFEFWRCIEEHLGVRSIFYVYAKARRSNPKTWLLDPSYDISVNSRLQESLRKLIARGFEVGLHGSYDSAENELMLASEKHLLEKALGVTIGKVRQHWLRFNERKTPVFHEKFFNQDSTLGFNDTCGFRSGCASRYRPWNHTEHRPFAHVEVPQILMDSHIFDYGAHDVEDRKHRALQILEQLAPLKNVHVSISWHQRVCARDYGWHHFYLDIINWNSSCAKQVS